MKNPIINEVQFNYIKLFNVVLLLTIAITGYILFRYNFITYSVYQTIFEKVLIFVSIPIVLVIRILQWTGLIPAFNTNPLMLIWPQLNQSNYPTLFKYSKVFNIILLFVILIWSYMNIKHGI